MKIRVILNREPQTWQANFLDACRRADFDVMAARGSDVGRDDPTVRLLLWFERHIYRSDVDSLARANVLFRSSADPDITVDLSGTPGDIRQVPNTRITLRPSYDGFPTPAAAVSALLDRRSPVIAVLLQDAQGSRLISRAEIAVTDRGILSRGLDQTFARVISLLMRALHEIRQGLDQPPWRADYINFGREAAFVFAGNALAAKAKGFLFQLLINREHWRVAYRQVRSASVLESLQSSELDWNFVPDDGHRFYADPFIFKWNGQTHLFVEEFPYRTCKGIISHCVVGADGSSPAPAAILEADLHMSYPFVFEHGGCIYMIPETGAARRVDLYRASNFPTGWVLEQTLVQDVDAFDATLLQFAGRYWLFVALGEYGSSTHDALGIFYADNLHGPWKSHPRNPVLIDVGAARPAGAVFMHRGQLIRPAQDCTGSYGRAVVFCALETLTTTDFQQRPVARFDPPSNLSGLGAHTFNCNSEFEVIDIKQAVFKHRRHLRVSSG